MAASRYRVIEREGQERIMCLNSPDIHLNVEKGLTVDETGRTGFPKRTIFLDGVYQGAPFYDNKLKQYSLDHHLGCVRAFTLATAEQAVVLLLQGLALGKGRWMLHVNSPDLDAVLAAWVLMNHSVLMRTERRILKRIMPLVRLEGVIDAHGFGWEVLTAFPDRMLRTKMQDVEKLLAREKDIKARGEWSSTDFTAFSRAMLDDLDAVLLTVGEIDELKKVEEIDRVALEDDHVAILCRSHLGIYEIERTLKEQFDENLGIIVLENEPGHYSLRLSNPFLSSDLDTLYQALNEADPSTSGENEDKNCWGGASDIGGSPRSTGTGLQGDQIMRIIGRIFRAQDD
jgi:hypothetical protein